MPRIALVVTGDLERAGLAQSLQRAFPQAQFTIESKLDGFTSARVAPSPATKIPTLVDKLARALVAAVDPGRTGSPADRAIVVDDLELANTDQPQVVVDAFRQAVVRHVDAHWPSQQRRARARERLRERASFHLMAPMTEAYFFGAAAPLAAAGVRAEPILVAGHDLEDFTVEDPGFLRAPDAPRSWARPDRARHPKRYLQYLIDPSEKVRYRETQQGVAALAATTWPGLASASAPRHLRFLRALLADIADSLGLAGSECSPHVTWQRDQGVLRNI